MNAGRSSRIYFSNAPVVQWIGHKIADLATQVRFLPGAQKQKRAERPVFVFIFLGLTFTIKTFMV